jgi:hypothetical protein
VGFSEARKGCFETESAALQPVARVAIWSCPWRATEARLWCFGRPSRMLMAGCRWSTPTPIHRSHSRSYPGQPWGGHMRGYLQPAAICWQIKVHADPLSVASTLFKVVVRPLPTSVARPALAAAILGWFKATWRVAAQQIGATPNGQESTSAWVRGRLRSCRRAPSGPLCSWPSKPRYLDRCAPPAPSPSAVSRQPLRNNETSHSAPGRPSGA